MGMRSMNERPVTLLNSGICTQAQLESETFLEWARRLGERPGHMHRKLWEWCFITQALFERNLLAPGVSGLGFAVGTEPLTAFFCSLGASVRATDLYSEVAKKRGWDIANQNASSIESLNLRGLCPDALFNKNCTFQHVDMNNIPKDLKDFDFIWSSCALEHLGSLQKGEEFIYNAMNCLKPGGFAIHTTEYNYSSNSSTLSSGGTVLYRRQDMEKIIGKLLRAGHTIDMDYASGDMPLDTYIDLPPYTHDPHIKLQFEKYVITSIGLIIQKKKSEPVKSMMEKIFRL